MSGLENTVKRTGNLLTGKGYMTNKERKQARESKAQAEKDKMFASAEIPDSEAIKRNERRKAAKRVGSRVSTVLTEDTLG